MTLSPGAKLTSLRAQQARQCVQQAVDWAMAHGFPLRERSSREVFAALVCESLRQAGHQVSVEKFTQRASWEGDRAFSFGTVALHIQDDGSSCVVGLDGVVGRAAVEDRLRDGIARGNATARFSFLYGDWDEFVDHRKWLPPTKHAPSLPLEKVQQVSIALAALVQAQHLHAQTPAVSSPRPSPRL